MGWLTRLFEPKIEIPDPADYGVTPVRSFTTRIAGVSKRNSDGTKRQDILGRCEEGERLLLLREPENRYDPDAIAVFRATHEQVGYVPGDVAFRLGQQMDSGLTAMAEIVEIRGGTRKKPTLGCAIEIQLFKAGDE